MCGGGRRKGGCEARPSWAVGKSKTPERGDSPGGAKNPRGVHGGLESETKSAVSGEGEGRATSEEPAGSRTGKAPGLGLGAPRLPGV